MPRSVPLCDNVAFDMCEAHSLLRALASAARKVEAKRMHLRVECSAAPLVERAAAVQSIPGSPNIAVQVSCLPVHSFNRPFSACFSVPMHGSISKTLFLMPESRFMKMLRIHSSLRTAVLHYLALQPTRQDSNLFLLNRESVWMPIISHVYALGLCNLFMAFSCKRVVFPIRTLTTIINETNVTTFSTRNKATV